jgi:acetate kinase
MHPAILTLNAGSSTVKYALFEVEPGGALIERARGTLEETGQSAMTKALEVTRAAGLEVTAVGHRVVHGSLRYSAPARIDDAVLAELESFVPLAPLHQPHNVLGIRAAKQAFPAVPQVACFDTAFHRTRTFAEEAYALPRRFFDEGVRRFGFHGLSYEFVARQLAVVAPDVAKGRVVVAHLGSGASMCALVGGASVASTMEIGRAHV